MSSNFSLSPNHSASSGNLDFLLVKIDAFLWLKIGRLDNSLNVRISYFLHIYMKEVGAK